MHCGCCVRVAACVSFHISAGVFLHSDTAVEELLNLEPSLTMTSSTVPVPSVCCDGVLYTSPI